MYCRQYFSTRRQEGVVLGAEADKIECLSSHQNAGQNHYSNTWRRHQQINEEIKSGLIVGNPCYRSVHDVLSSRLLFYN